MERVQHRRTFVRINTDTIYKKCQYCGNLYTRSKDDNYKQFVEKGKFCSKSCHISNNNINRICKDSTKEKHSKHAKTYIGENNPNYQGGGIEYKCVFCGNTFRIPVGQITGNKYVGKYCSLECYHHKREKYRCLPTKAHVNKTVQRALITWVRKDFKSGKSKWVSILEYNGIDLKNHIELLFIEDMNWGNYGKWHIDHVKPISYFNYTSEYDPEFKQCWSLHNLQPLWALDNLHKGGHNTKINQKIYGT